MFPYEAFFNYGLGGFGMFLIWRLAVKHIDKNTETLNTLCGILNRLEGKIDGK